MYSVVAGFVEAGENAECAVAREVFEEVGLRVRNINYHSSQPWPFPSSLMLGFNASASSQDTIRLDGELEDARWFSAAELAAGAPRVLPPPYSIARRLVDAWYLRVTGTALVVPQ